MIAADGPTPLWYAARSTGYVSLLLLTAILLLGIVTSMRVANREWPRFLSQALHRNLSLMVLVFLTVHIVTSVADPFAGISWLNAAAPFTGSYRPIWLGLGVVSTELIVALVVTSLLRQRIPFGLWRLIHWAAYVCWPVALLHTLGTGSDVRSWWAVSATVICIGFVVLAIGWRLLAERVTIPGIGRVAGLVACGAATIAVAGFALAGPLHSGWARAAGTPDRLLAAGTSGDVTPAQTPLATALPTGVVDQLSGTVARSGRTTAVTLTDDRDASLRLVAIVAAGAATGQLTITENGSTLCNVVASVGQDLQATCGNVALDIALALSGDGRTVTGQLTTRAAGQ